MNNKNIYLTFDDGPSIYTNELLDILKKYNVKATFFINGYNLDTEKGQKTLQRILDEGHTIGLHTNSHDYSYIYASVDNFLNDLKLLEKKVIDLTGIKPEIFRFPGGSSNTISKNYKIGIMTELVEIINSLGFFYFDWNINSLDIYFNDATIIAKYVISKLGKFEDNIILQHDTKPESIKAVPLIIEHALNHDFTFKTLNSQSPSIHHNIYN